MFAIVGNSPSSGSTFLGDLLDSTPIGVCGPELNIFTNSDLYTDFEKFCTEPFKLSLSSSLYVYYNYINKTDLYNYALDEAALGDILKKSDNAISFFESFGYRYSAFRGKHGAVWFEKTPQNINVASTFLSTFSRSHFIHIVRNPLYVIPSLLKRGFSLWIAVFTWLFDVAHVMKITSNRLILVKYEDVVINPWLIAQKIFKGITGETVSTATIEDGYHNNIYRREAEVKIQTWGVNKYGEIRDANKKTLSIDLLEKIKLAMDYRISDSWAKKYNVPNVSFREAIEYFGYADEVERILSTQNKYSGKVLSSLNEKWFFAKKYFSSRLNSNKDAPFIVNPVQHI